jgi:hypothetical protein
VLYEINPWMHEEVAVEHDLASQQWSDPSPTCASPAPRW